MDNLAELGGELRAHREALGYSRDDVYLKLHIPSDMVRALEDGDIKPLPAPCYVRGFLQSYCALLELDPAPYVEAYRQLLEPDQSFHVLPVREPRSAEPAASRWLTYAITWTAICGAAALGWFIYANIFQPSDDPAEHRVEAETLVDMVVPPTQEENRE
ncbi:MAG: helix-turn-helix domain-containing protein [Candidatus Hydrogenedentota bacterium]